MSVAALRAPQQLYEDWEDSHWRARDVDLAQDRANWAALEVDERETVLWALSSLLVAEERITTKFTGLVMAYDDEEEESFLVTQQVDEARHLQFYARFQNEVVAEPEAIAAHVARARRRLGPSFHAIFDEALVQAHERLAGEPRDRAAKVDFVTIYHMVIEGTLGVTAHHFITSHLEGREILPGFVEGYGRIARDEQRHVAYGAWFLQQAVAADTEMAQVVRDRLASLLPAVAQALAPPGGEGAAAGAEQEILGVSPDEARAFALDALTRRLALIGVPLAA